MLVIGSSLNIYQLGGLSILAVVYVMQIHKLCDKMKDEEEKKIVEEKEEKFTAVFNDTASTGMEVASASTFKFKTRVKKENKSSQMV